MIMTVLFFMVKFCFNAHLLNLSFKLSNLTKEDYKMIPESSPCCWLPLVLLLQKILILYLICQLRQDQRLKK
jgi:hypothetical protein